MGDTCLQSPQQVYTFCLRMMISLEVLVLMMAVVVPHTVAKPQDLFQTISGLTQELANIAAAQALQSQFEIPGLRIRPSSSSSGNRYYYSVSSNGGNAFASVSGAPEGFVYSGTPYRRRPSYSSQSPNPTPVPYQANSRPESFESVNLRLGSPNRGSYASSSVYSPNSPVSASAGASS